MLTFAIFIMVPMLGILIHIIFEILIKYPLVILWLIAAFGIAVLIRY